MRCGISKSFVLGVVVGALLVWFVLMIVVAVRAAEAAACVPFQMNGQCQSATASGAPVVLTLTPPAGALIATSYFVVSCAPAGAPAHLTVTGAIAPNAPAEDLRLSGTLTNNLKFQATIFGDVGKPLVATLDSCGAGNTGSLYAEWVEVHPLLIPPPSGGPLITVTPATTPSGGTVTAAWSGILTPTAKDWIGLYATGADDRVFKAWIYTTGTALGSTNFPVPAGLPSGVYELRLFAQDGFTKLAISGPLTIP